MYRMHYWLIPVRKQISDFGEFPARALPVKEYSIKMKIAPKKLVDTFPGHCLDANNEAISTAVTLTNQATYPSTNQATKSPARAYPSIRIRNDLAPPNSRADLGLITSSRPDERKIAHIFRTYRCQRTLCVTDRWVVGRIYKYSI